MKNPKARGKSVRMTVTPNVEYSIKVLKKAMKNITDEEASGAISYIEKASKGEIQPLSGRGCIVVKRIEKEL